jgi:hypothetical protein
MVRKNGKDPGDDSPENIVPNPGGMFRRVRSETLDLTREEAIEAAEAHQSLPQSPTERDLDPKRVKELACRIAAGWWLPCQWATVIFNKTKYRMNGQHSSAAMIEGGEALPDRVAIHLDHFEAPDVQGMGVLFRQFDARFSARSAQDVAGAYQGLVESLKGVGKRKAKFGIEGVAWYLRAIEGLPVQGPRSRQDPRTGEEAGPRRHLPHVHHQRGWCPGLLAACGQERPDG